MKNQSIVKHKHIPIKLAKKIIFSLIIVLAFDFFLFPMPVLAAQLDKTDVNIAITQENPIITPFQAKKIIINNLPLNDDRAVIRTSNHWVTAYNSEVAQCDSSPCITANGFNLCEHGIEDSIAANFLVFGTQIRMPEIFGDKIFTVRDRMNKRYTNRIDIWMINKGDAKKFGLKYVKLEILEP